MQEIKEEQDIKNETEDKVRKEVTIQANKIKDPMDAYHYLKEERLVRMMEEDF